MSRDFTQVEMGGNAPKPHNSAIFDTLNRRGTAMVPFCSATGATLEASQKRL